MAIREDLTALSSTLAVRSQVMESVVIALAFGIGINLATGGLLLGSKGANLMIIGGVICLAAISWLVHMRLKAAVSSTTVKAALLVDTDSGDLLEGGEYWFGLMASDYTLAAFDEMPELEAQWKALAKRGADDPDDDSDVLDRRIAKEIMQYFTIERLALTLGDYYDQLDSSVTKRDPLVTYERDQLPALLLENRLLELFSRDMIGRSDFGEPEDYHPVPMEMLTSAQTDSRYFQKFELTLPKSCRVSLDNGTIVITGPNLKVEIVCECDGVNVSAPYGYLQHVLGIGDPLDVDSFEVRTIIKTRLTRRLFFGRRQQLRDGWVDEFVDSMIRRADWGHYLTSIHWPLLEAMISVWRPPASLPPS
jgi:hypothetical protein